MGPFNWSRRFRLKRIAVVVLAGWVALGCSAAGADDLEDFTDSADAGGSDSGVDSAGETSAPGPFGGTGASGGTVGSSGKPTTGGSGGSAITAGSGGMAVVGTGGTSSAVGGSAGAAGAPTDGRMAQGGVPSSGGASAAGAGGARQNVGGAGGSAGSSGSGGSAGKSSGGAGGGSAGAASEVRSCTWGSQSPQYANVVCEGKVYCSEALTCASCPGAELGGYPDAYDCNANGRDACETSASNQNCGGCGIVCGANTTCRKGGAPLKWACYPR
jgi:hypothetical protein